MIIVDYADLLKGNSRKERHEELEEIVEGLRGIAGEYECPLFTASQINRSEDYYMVLKSRSFSIDEKDFVVSLSRKIEDKLKETVDKNVIKNRFETDGMTFHPKKI